jgi:hypothetical protein
VLHFLLALAQTGWDRMPRIAAALLAALGVAMSALVAFVHGDLIWVAILVAASATGLAALSQKKKSAMSVFP